MKHIAIVLILTFVYGCTGLADTQGGSRSPDWVRVKMIRIGEPQFGDTFTGRLYVGLHNLGGTSHTVKLVRETEGDTLTAFMGSGIASRDGETLWVIPGRDYAVLLEQVARPANAGPVACDTSIVYYVDGAAIQSDCTPGSESAYGRAPLPWSDGESWYWKISAIRPKR